MVRVHHVATRGARSRTQDGGTEADAMTVRLPAPAQPDAAARVTPPRRRGRSARRRRRAH